MRVSLSNTPRRDSCRIWSSVPVVDLPCAMQMHDSGSLSFVGRDDCIRLPLEYRAAVLSQSKVRPLLYPGIPRKMIQVKKEAETLTAKGCSKAQ